MSAISLTFGEQSENHHTMNKNGVGLNEYGYSLENLKNFSHKYPNSIIIPLYYDTLPEAYVLYIPRYISNNLFNFRLYEDLKGLNWDKHYYDDRRGKVLNKHARYNLCFSENAVLPDYENKQGTVVAYDDVPRVYKLREKIRNDFNIPLSSLECEGNYYYDLDKTGIGFHGDTERKCVIGFNLATESRILRYKWFRNNVPITDPIDIELNNGDLYIMSEYATGNNWKDKSVPTLRHSAGIKYSKYLS